MDCIHTHIPTMAVAKTALLTLALMIVIECVSSQDIIKYSIEEESEIGQHIGAVFKDAGLDTNHQVDENGYLIFTDNTDDAASLFSLSAGRNLTVGDRLNREAICPGKENCIISLDLQLEPQSFFKIIKVQITISDINDNAPSFTGPIVSRSVSEAAAVGFKIPLPSAVDPDSPANGIDHYWINDTNGLFELDQAGSPAQYLVVKGRLDREQQDLYLVQLVAIDKGDPAKSGSAVLEISVVDVNDNLPTFDNDTYYVIIPEDFPLRLSVISVHASDKDTGSNAEVHYGFDATTELKYGEYFSVDEFTGIIRVTKSLDFEMTSFISLMVTATNPDDSSMSSFTNVHVNIGDVNDNPPQIKVRGISPGNIVYKEETSALDDFVAHVSVSDPDSGNNGQFECLLSGRDFKLIKMYNTDYVIQNNIPLDREFRAEYNVIMTCVDKGKQRQTQIQDIKIVISDVNDHSPEFSKQTYYATIIENNQVGSPVTKVTASDVDAGLNGTVTYGFAEDMSDILQIDSNTGSITAAKPLDRESMDSIRVLVIASDKGTPKFLSATATVTIDIIDVDDNEPEFTQSEYSFWSVEGQSIQSFVGQVNASDPDTDVFNQFAYFINYDGADSESFTIDRNSGKIYTSRVLDRERHLNYQFTVRVVNDGPLIKSSTASVIVHLSDINDNEPYIEYPNPTNNSVYLSNSIKEGTVISHVVAWDLDLGENAELVYFLVSGNDGGHFSVGTGGAVTVSRSLKKFDHRAFGLVIMVSDNGSPPMSSESYLNVIVNKSLDDSANGLMSRQNLTIVISIATISGLLMVILIVAIVVLLRWPGIRARASARKYNYVARKLDHKISANPDGINAYDNKSCDVEHDAESNNTQLNNSKRDTTKDHTQKDISYKDHDNNSFNFQVNLKRQKGHDSECSSASSAGETDSGRGSHEDVVLDQSGSRLQLDRSRDRDDFHKQNDLPLLNALHIDPRHHMDHPMGGWSSQSPSYSQHSPHNSHHSHPHHNRPQYPPRVTVDLQPEDPHLSRDNPGYSWQSSRLSSEVHV